MATVMFDLILGAVILQSNPVLAQVKQETVVEEKAPPEIVEELTVEEKIAQNYYGCDESVEWIRKDTAECLPKPVRAAQTTGTVNNTTSAQTTIRTAVNAPSGWYPYGQCTYWVWSKRSVGQWNNAISWTWQAQRDGWATGNTPKAGAIGQKGNHVVYVESVNGDGTFNLSEMNWSGLGVVTHRTVSSVGWNFIY